MRAPYESGGEELPTKLTVLACAKRIEERWKARVGGGEITGGGGKHSGPPSTFQPELISSTETCARGVKHSDPQALFKQS